MEFRWDFSPTTSKAPGHSVPEHSPRRVPVDRVRSTPQGDILRGKILAPVKIVTRHSKYHSRDGIQRAVVIASEKGADEKGPETAAEKRADTAHDTGHVADVETCVHAGKIKFNNEATTKGRKASLFVGTLFHVKGLDLGFDGIIFVICVLCSFLGTSKRFLVLMRSLLSQR